ncbi:hypothetical protein FB567DRAFT_598268 [Paraphoma chrysanthemicola]|uniref:Uncharacterized protein n=1 Tax=Paraphoma chrysanthemicola TaxID=798071 RepID=A0A8K0QTF7_9PLEO|nr:hypothetical protein FB567DRAFT_598268 [Paraphoma chrysanthemicola]
MKINTFELYSLILASILFGVIGSAYFNHDLVTDREMALVFGFYISALMTFFARDHHVQAVVSYLSRHVTDVEKQQFADLQEAHRRQVNMLKSEHSVELRHLRGNLNDAHGEVTRINDQYDWVCAEYQEQLRVNQEQQDRIKYLEDLRKQNGVSSPLPQLPYSAPASQIKFSDPTVRARFPLAPVVEVEEQ